MNAILILCALAFPAAAQQAKFEELWKEAQSAKQAHDAPRYLVALEGMNAIRPNHPEVMAILVAAYGMNGRVDDALAIAGRLLRMKVCFDVTGADFDPLRADPRFAKITESLKALHAERVAGAHIAFRIAQKGLIPEGLAFDAKSERFFVSSARLGRIVQVDRHNHASDFVRSGIAGVHSLSGIGIDARRRILWACSTASPRFASYKQGDANDPSVVAFDLNSGKLIRRIAFEDPKGFCDDLTVGNDGSVYVSDSTGSLLALAPEGTRLTTLVPHGVIRSPQGTALSADERILYVADYGGPIRAVDPRTGDVAPLRLPEDFQSMTIDGITRDGNRLIAVQNGIEPNRIVALTLSRDGLTATSWQILEMNHPLIDEPTIGKVVGGTYFFSGASQGNKFDAGKPDPAKLTDAIVFAIPLGSARASARHSRLVIPSVESRDPGGWMAR